MKNKVLIHKLVVTEEAKFDYRKEIRGEQFPKKDIMNKIEEYIGLQRNRFANVRYFRVKYYDESTDKMLMLFIYKIDLLACMQLWELAGICLAEDWTEELEDSGAIRNWLKTKIENIPIEEDWVVRYRKWEAEKIEYQETFNIVGLSKEVTNAIKY